MTVRTIILAICASTSITLATKSVAEDTDVCAVLRDLEKSSKLGFADLTTRPATTRKYDIKRWYLDGILPGSEECLVEHVPGDWHDGRSIVTHKLYCSWLSESEPAAKDQGLQLFKSATECFPNAEIAEKDPDGGFLRFGITRGLTPSASNGLGIGTIEPDYEWFGHSNWQVFLGMSYTMFVEGQE
ncbi:MAG: hypothetical protein AAGI88_02495 [Pseudomonadota bacterium]